MKIIIKLGGALITQKSRKDFPTNINEIRKQADEFIKYDILKRLAKEISNLDIDLIIINGVGPFGHFLVDKKCDAKTIHSSVELLNQKIIEIFKKENLDLVPVHPYETCFYKNEFQINKLWNKTKQIIENKKIPITYGDIVPTTKKNHKVISGDDLAVGLAKRWNPDKIIMVTDVDGVFTKNPETNSDAELILKLKEITDAQFEITNIDITGGLQSKVKKLLGVDVTSQIINGSKKGNIEKAVKGKSVGTIVR